MLKEISIRRFFIKFILKTVFVVHLILIIFGYFFVISPLLDRGTSDLVALVDLMKRDGLKDLSDIKRMEYQVGELKSTPSKLMFNRVLGKKLSKAYSEDIVVFKSILNNDEIFWFKLKKDVFYFSQKKLAANPFETLFLSIILGFVLTTILSIFFLKKLLYEIYRLNQLSSLIAKGDYSVDFIPGAYRETNQVGDTLMIMAKKMDELLKNRSLFFAQISHDLKTPLSRIVFTIELLEEKLEKEDILSDIKDMNELISTSVAFSKGEKLSTSVNLELVKFLNLYCRKTRKFSFKTHLKEQKTQINSSDLLRVLDNLTGNSLKYGKPPFLILLEKNNKELKITVKDSGSGFEADFYKKQMGLFKQGNSDKEGDGVGLFTVLEICKRNNWRIEPSWKEGSFLIEISI